MQFVTSFLRDSFDIHKFHNKPTFSSLNPELMVTVNNTYCYEEPIISYAAIHTLDGNTPIKDHKTSAILFLAVE